MDVVHARGSAMSRDKGEQLMILMNGMLVVMGQKIREIHDGENREDLMTRANMSFALMAGMFATYVIDTFEIDGHDKCLLRFNSLCSSAITDYKKDERDE